MKQNILDIKGLKVGQAQKKDAKTGVTVILAENGAVCGVDVRGAAPGTRETDLLHPCNAMERVHAVVLSGGSAFGLAAADGVMAYLEAHGIGFDVGCTKVPIVPAAVLFDLGNGNPFVRPGPADWMHFDADSNPTFARALASMVKRIFTHPELLEDSWC